MTLVTKMGKLVHDVCRLVARWWQADRPRVDPREGRLLRIQPAAILRIDSRLIEVVRRTAGEDQRGPFVIYHCRSNGHASELHVTPPVVHGRCALRWTENDAVRELVEEDVEVFQPK